MDLLSVDIDGNDFHVLNAILRHGYRPRVIVVEYQSALPAEHDMVLLYEKTHRWDGSCYSSGGILSYSHLGAHYGYTLVGATGPNLYFVRDTVLAAAHGPTECGQIVQDWVPVCARGTTFANWHSLYCQVREVSSSFRVRSRSDHHNPNAHRTRRPRRATIGCRGRAPPRTARAC